MRNRLLAVTALFLAALAAGTPCIAIAAWPTKAVRIVVPAAPGSAPDVAIRIVGARVNLLLKQPVIIENKVGAGGIIAMQSFRASHDDHTFLMVITSTSAIAPLTFKGAAAFDFTADLRPVVQFAETPLMVVATVNSGMKSMADVLAAARAKPGDLIFATPGPNSLGNLSVVLLTQLTGARFHVVPYLRPAESMAAVYSGEAGLFVDGVSVVLPFVRANKLQPIAVLSRTKLPGLQDYALGNESTKDFEVTGSFGLVASKETSSDVIAAFQNAVASAMGDPEVIDKLAKIGLFPKQGGPAEYRMTLEREAKLWRGVVRGAGIQPE